MEEEHEGCLWRKLLASVAFCTDRHLVCRQLILQSKQLAGLRRLVSNTCPALHAEGERKHWIPPEGSLRRGLGQTQLSPNHPKEVESPQISREAQMGDRKHAKAALNSNYLKREGARRFWKDYGGSGQPAVCTHLQVTKEHTQQATPARGTLARASVWGGARMMRVPESHQPSQKTHGIR